MAMGRLAYKSNSKFFSSAKCKLEIRYVYAAKLGPTTGTGNEKRRTLRKSSAWVKALSNDTELT